MKQRSISAALSAAAFVFCGNASAYEASPVSIMQAHSFNSGGHLWFEISGSSDCPTPSRYFIIQRWDNQV